MTGLDARVTETTRIEVLTPPAAGGGWDLLVLLARTVGLDGADPVPATAAAPSGWTVSGVTGTGLVTLIVNAVSVELHTTVTGEAAEDHLDAMLHSVVLEAAADWLHDRGAVWRWTVDGCAPDSWHCGGRLYGWTHSDPEAAPVPARPVARWQRWAGRIAAGIGEAAALVLPFLFLALVVHAAASRAELDGGPLAGWAGTPAGWLWTLGVPVHAVTVLAAALLLRRAAQVAAAVLDPASEGWAGRWWQHLRAQLRESGGELVLAVSLLTVGAGWLS